MTKTYSELKREYNNLLMHTKAVEREIKALKNENNVYRRQQTRLKKFSETADTEVKELNKEIETLKETIQKYEETFNQQDFIIGAYQQWFADREYVTHTHQLPEERKAFTAFP